MKSLRPYLFFLLIPFLAHTNAGAIPKSGLFGRNQTDVVVEGFKWRSGGPGRRAVFSEVTLTNTGETDYSSVNLKALFYKRDGSPAGSTRGTLREELKAGETRTFSNVRMGVMNSLMDSVKLKVTGARPAEGSEGPSHPLKVLKIEWQGGGAGTGVGTVGAVTVKNPSSVPYGSVKFRIIQKSSGKATAQTEMMTKRIAEARSETVYKNINPGFVRPDTDEIDVRIGSARAVSPKREALIRKSSRAERAVRRDDAEPVPAYDIKVEDFEWGSGIAGSAGIIRRLVLKNRSAVRYSEITMEVEFLSRRGTPLISNRFRVKNPPPPGETVVYENLSIGIINVSPDGDMVNIRVWKGRR